MELPLADGRVLEYLILGDLQGRPTILYPGTPATAGCGAVVAEAAADQGVQLIAVSRPGYGTSSPTAPGLASVARDTLALMESLGLSRVGAHGISGGGPFALALAAVAPERVSRVVVSAGPGSCAAVGALSPAESEAVARMQSGDPAGAWRLLADDAAAEIFGDVARMDEAQFRARQFPSGAPPGSYFDRNPASFEVFVADMHRALQRVDGYVRDNLSWCGAWDIDLADVTAPVLLAYGRDDQMVPAAHGRWLHARLRHADLQLRDGNHGDITFGLAAEAYGHLA